MLGKSSRNDKDDESQPPSWLDTSYDHEFAVNVVGDHDDDDDDKEKEKGSLLLHHRQYVDDEEVLAAFSSNYSQMEVDRVNQNRGDSRRRDRLGKKSRSNSNKISSIQDMWSHYGTMMSRNHDDESGDEEGHPFKNAKSDMRRQRQRQKTTGVLLEQNKPRRSCGLQIFFLLELYAILTWLGLFISQILPFILFAGRNITSTSSPTNDEDIGDDGNGRPNPTSKTIIDHPVDLALRIFISIFSCLFIVVEYDPPMKCIRKSGFLQAYISRGFLYEFLGLVCLQQSYSEFVDDMIQHRYYYSMTTDQQEKPPDEDDFHVSWFPLFVQISAYCACALGVVYFCMGLFCLKRLRDRLYREDKKKWDDYRDRLKQHWEENPYI